MSEENKTDEIKENELKNVGGGSGTHKDKSQALNVVDGSCIYCASKLTYLCSTRDDWYMKYDLHSCPTCYREYRRYQEGDYWTFN